MAINTTQHFRNANKVITFRTVVSNAGGGADMFPADATYLRDLTKLIAINKNAAPVTLTIYETDNAGANAEKIHVVSIPANSGQLAGSLAIKLINDPTYQISGVRYDAFGNFFFRVAPGKKLKAESSVASDLILYGELEGYEE